MVLRKPDPKFGAALRALRISRGQTQQQLAVRAGITDTTMRGVELGRTTPNRATLAAIANAMGMTVDELLAAGNSVS